MIYGSLFSGIEGASVAWAPLGWRCAWVAETDQFASALLAHRYPEVPNLGDVECIDAGTIEPVDLVVFGSPCQSFSVAGKRLGLDDPRGNMALVGLRLVGKLRPRWVVWENVPGVLSSDGGRDFGAFLGLLAELGYGFAYAILDAQHFGVPQRRRRVFVVGCLGDWRAPAAVLFEPESLRGDSPPRRQAGENAPTIPARSTAGGGLGTDHDINGGLIAKCLEGHPGRRDLETETFIAATAPPCTSIPYGDHESREGLLIAGHFEQNSMAGRGTLGWNDGDQPLRPVKPQGDHQMLVTHSLRADGFDAGEDGTGRGTPLVVAETVRSHPRSGSNSVGAIAYGIRSDAARNGEALTPSADAEGRIRLRDPGFNVYEERAPTLDSAPHAVGAPGMSVRRLTPRECLRLQGFPDDYLDIQYRGKPAADGPKYRAIGNSFAVPVVRYIGQRIQLFEDAVCAQEAAE